MSVSKPTLRDRILTDWVMQAALILDGGTPKRKHLEALLRMGEGDIPQEVRNFIADALYRKNGGRPTKSKAQAEADEWRRAEAFIADVERLRAGGLSQAKAFDAYNKERGSNATRKSTERIYRHALAIAKLRRDEAAAIMRSAASLMGISEAELDRRIARL